SPPMKPPRHQHLPSAPPSRATLHRWLARAVERQLVRGEATNRRNVPYRYRLAEGWPGDVDQPCRRFEPVTQPPTSAASVNRPRSSLRAAGVPRKASASATQLPAFAWANATEAATPLRSGRRRSTLRYRDLTNEAAVGCLRR